MQKYKWNWGDFTMSDSEITKSTTVKGRLKIVYNRKRPKFSNAAKLYLALWLEDENGGNERCVLLTNHDIKSAEYRASKNPEDLLSKPTFLTLFGGAVKGRLYLVPNTLRKKFSNANMQYYAIWVEDDNGENDRCVLFTENQIKRAEVRAAKNPEDVPDKNFIIDLVD